MSKPPRYLLTRVGAKLPYAKGNHKWDLRYLYTNIGKRSAAIFVTSENKF